MSAVGPEPAEPEPLRLVHHHPGRLRVRADAFVGDEGEAIVRVRRALLAVPGVADVAHNAKTGSVLVSYEPGHAEPDAILAVVAEAAGLGEIEDDAAARARRPDPATTIVRAVRTLDAVAKELSGGRADLRTLVPTVLASAAAYSWVLGKGPRLPRWDNLLFWSYSMFRDLNRERIDAEAAREK